MFCSVVLRPYPAINSIISLIHQGIQQVLGKDYVAFILHGSLAVGGFDPSHSDVDFLVVTQEEVNPTQYHLLQQMHESISASGQPWSTNMEGSYIPVKALVRYNPKNCEHPVLRTDGSFGFDGHGTDWILQRWNIREHGIALFGPEPVSLIAPILPDEMRQAVMGILKDWWEPMLTEEYRLNEAEYQAYAVMTMCRSFYTMATAQVAPKPIAAAFAQENLDLRWAGLIESAATWHHGAAMDRKDEVKDFIRFTVDECERRLYAGY